MAETVSLDWIRFWHRVAGVIHLIVGIVVVIMIATSTDTTTRAWANVSTRKSKAIADPDHEGPISNPPAYEEIPDGGSISVEGLTYSFFFLTALAHFLYTMNPTTLQNIVVRDKRNSFRWVEYGITATLMILGISALSGITNRNSLVNIASATMFVMATGYLFEEFYSKESSKWLAPFPIILGFLVLAGVWWNIIEQFSTTIDAANEVTDIPEFVRGVIWFSLALFASFGVVPVLQMFTNLDYSVIELIYVALSMISKVGLGLWLAIGITSAGSDSS
jgi:hypothetical protein